MSDLAWYVSHIELRDDRATLFAPYLPAGVYRYAYTVQPHHACPTSTQGPQLIATEAVGRGQHH
jgi:hypothetical protein